MLTIIESLLTPVQLQRIENFITQAEFIDGKLSAGSEAEQEKTI